MKIKLDENIPYPAWPDSLDDIDTVAREGLSGANDQTVFEAAQREHRFLITQDLDFSDVRRFVPGSHSGILLMHLRVPSRRALIRRLEEILHRETLEDWQGCFVVATDAKIRVIKPR